MPRKERQKLHNPITGGDQSFTGIGHGAPINFNQDELESELLDLLGESEPKPKSTKPTSNKKNVDWNELDSMINECMADHDDDDEDIDDPDLEAELLGMVDFEPAVSKPQKLAPTPSPKPSSAVDSVDAILQERLSQYQLAIAKTSGAKQKRYQRQLKQVERQIQTAKKGGVINPDDIPSQPPGIGLNPAPATPIVQASPAEPVAAEQRAPPRVPERIIEDKSVLPIPSRIAAPPIPARVAAPAVPVISPLELDEGATRAAESGFKLDLMKRRLSDYKSMALMAKKEGNKPFAIQCFTVMKSLQTAIDDTNIDFDVPPKPTKPPPSPAKPVQSSPALTEPTPPQTAVAPQPTPPKTLLEGLEQRRLIFVQSEQKATAEGNGSKARRLGRQRKQYDDVIKQMKAGKHPAISHLTVPPNSPPLPGESDSQISFEETLQKATNVANQPEEGETAEHTPTGIPTPSPTKTPPKPHPVRSEPMEMPHLPGATKAGSNQDSAYSKQINFITNRYHDFKKAAIEAKKQGDKKKAVEFLKVMKGLEPMMENARKGLPIDIRKIPPPPDYDSFVVVEMTAGSKSTRPSLDRQDSTSTRLLQDFADQLKKARSLTTQFTQLGSLEKATTMEKWAKQTQRDMDTVKMAIQRGSAPPPVKWEKRHIEAIKLCTDLSADECEVSIIRAMNIPGDAGDIHCYVQAEFPYPKEKPGIVKTAVLKGTKDPVFQHKDKVEISRRHTTFKRAVKNKGVKFILSQKGGFFHSDKVLGTATLQLMELETKCEVHSVLSVVDGRRPTGAKIEVKMRVREPFEGAEMISEDIQWVSLESTRTTGEKIPEMKIDVRALSVIKTEIGHCDTRRNNGFKN